MPLNRAMLRGERGLDILDWQASATLAACEDSPGPGRPDALVQGELQGCAATTGRGLLGSTWSSALVLKMDRLLGWLLPPCPGEEWAAAGGWGREVDFIVRLLPSVCCPGAGGAGRVAGLATFLVSAAGVPAWCEGRAGSLGVWQRVSWSACMQQYSTWEGVSE